MRDRAPMKIAWAAIRKNSKGELFIDTNTVDSEESFVKSTVAQQTLSTPLYCLENPLIRIGRVEVSEWIEDDGRGEFD